MPSIFAAVDHSRSIQTAWFLQNNPLVIYYTGGVGNFSPDVIAASSRPLVTSSPSFSAASFLPRKSARLPPLCRENSFSLHPLSAAIIFLPPLRAHVSLHCAEKIHPLSAATFTFSSIFIFLPPLRAHVFAADYFSAAYHISAATVAAYHVPAVSVLARRADLSSRLLHQLSAASFLPRKSARLPPLCRENPFSLHPLSAAITFSSIFIFLPPLRAHISLHCAEKIRSPSIRSLLQRSRSPPSSSSSLCCELTSLLRSHVSTAYHISAATVAAYHVPAVSVLAQPVNTHFRHI